MLPAPGIDRPIFIVGPHRSGTTVFYELLAAHPDPDCIARIRSEAPDFFARFEE